jgi:type II secretory pathway component PulC
MEVSNMSEENLTPNQEVVDAPAKVENERTKVVVKNGKVQKVKKALTKEEKNQLFKVFEDIRTTQALKGTYYQRWGILQAIHKAFLLAVGYDSFDWRS